MREYVAFLNDLHGKDIWDLGEIETYWIKLVHAFFAAKPFTIRLDASRGLRHVVRDILDQAAERQKSVPGMYYAGAVLQHLVGAKLDCALGTGKFEHNSFRRRMRRAIAPVISLSAMWRSTSRLPLEKR